jgi:hypothetical protein
MVSVYVCLSCLIFLCYDELYVIGVGCDELDVIDNDDNGI